MLEIDAVILAAGLARRMGCNKLLLPFADSTIIEHFLGRFPYHHFRRTFLVYSSDKLRQLAAGYPLQTIENIDPARGQSSSLKLACAKSESRDGIFCAVADQPLLQAHTIERMLKEFAESPASIIRPSVQGRPRNPVLFPAHLRSELLQLAGDEGGRQLIRRHQELLRDLAFIEAEQFMDIDTPERYQQLLTIYDERE